jgi:Zn-dependent oligopeptidase
MVANFAKPTPNCPALMLHKDVIWFFHEMGYIFHELLACTKFSIYHGTRVSLDFMEVSSQLVENWFAS